MRLPNGCGWRLKALASTRPPHTRRQQVQLRDQGQSITSHTARDWLLGKSIPMQDRDMLARYMTLSLADRKTVCWL